MPRLTESGIEFDLTAARSACRHDSVPGHGNRRWPGVDFCVEDADGLLWIEVKNWWPPGLPPHRRGPSRRSFLCSLRNGVLSRRLRDKLLGTTAYLTWIQRPPAEDLRFVVVLEPVQEVDCALLLALNDKLSSFARGPWAYQITCSAMNVEQWNARFPEYTARLVGST